MDQPDPALAAADAPPRVLVVDDEVNVLRALRRALRSHGYDVVTAHGGREALEQLARDPVDAIVCDMRMPDLSGAEVLAGARRLVPDAVRVLLTGHADLASAMAAVNEGEIFRYLCKPWDDQVLHDTLAEGLARRALERERDALRALVEQRNEELRALNAGLEAQVADRTQALQDALASVREAHGRAKQEFGSTVKLLSGLIAARSGLSARCPTSMARHVRAIGPALGLVGEALGDAVFAALLFDIGKLALPDALVGQPLEALATEERARMLRHTQLGESALMGMESLRGAAALLGQVYENFGGGGQPGLACAREIALGARILRVAADFEHLQAGVVSALPLTVEQAFRRLRQYRGTLYDPQVVDAMLEAHDQPVLPPPRRMLISSDSLRPGMVLAQDLVSARGLLLLASGQALDVGIIAHIRRIESYTGDFLWVAVCEDEHGGVRTLHADDGTVPA